MVRTTSVAVVIGAVAPLTLAVVLVVTVDATRTPPDATPTPPAEATEDRLDANRRVIESMSAEEAIWMSDTVVAFRSIRDVHDLTPVLMLYHLPTGSEIVLDADATELRRVIESPDAELVLEEALHDPGFGRIISTLLP